MAQNVPAESAGQQQAPQRPSGWQTIKSLLFQMLLFYLITSYFRGGKQPAKGPDGQPVVAASNIFSNGDQMVSYQSATPSGSMNLGIFAGAVCISEFRRRFQYELIETSMVD